MSTKTKDTRPEPNLSRDYYGDLYIVIDDDGEPVSDYQIDLNVAHRLRHRLNPEFRICRVSYKALPRDDGLPDDIEDDGRGGPAQEPLDEPERIRQEGYNAGYGDALRDEFRRETGKEE